MSRSKGWGVQFIGGPLDGETYPLQFQFLSAANLARYRWGEQMYRQTAVDPERQLFLYNGSVTRCFRIPA